MNFYEFLNDNLKNIKKNNLYRELSPISQSEGAFVKINEKKILQFSSNNYLGLAGDKRLINASKKMLEFYGGIGSTGSRLLSGTHNLHIELEEKIAELKGTESALVYSTGYAANIGVISSLFNFQDAVYSDELNHASIIDGIKLSRAEKFIYRHRDIKHLEELLEENHKNYRFNLIVTDSIFSMDGNRAHLKEIVELKEKYDALLYVDEAHAFGIYGPEGQGLAHEYQISGKVDIQMGTLSKAVGSEGGYIAGKKNLIDYLINKSRSFIYSTAPSIPSIAASIEGIKIIREDKELRTRMHQNIEYLKTLFAWQNLDIFPSESAIFCLKFNKTETACQIASVLLEKYNIVVSAIRPPTVRTPRIRICTSVMHSREDMDYLVNSLCELLLEE